MNSKNISKTIRNARRVYIFNKKTLYYILTAVTVISIIVVYFAVTGIINKNSSFVKYDLLISKLNNIVNFGENIPAVDKLRDLEKDKATLGEYFLELENSLGREKKHQIKTPMEFKGELLRTQRFLAEKSKSMGIVIPEDIGFGEYIKKMIPSKEEIPKLAGQISMLRSLINIFLDNGVIMISGVIRMDVFQQKAVSSDKDVFYNEHKFEIKFDASQDTLIRIISAMTVSKEFFILRDIEVKPVSESRYSVRMVISGIEFI